MIQGNNALFFESDTWPSSLESPPVDPGSARYALGEILSAPSPCDSCSARRECCSWLMACETFAEYVQNGRFQPAVRNPTLRGYEKLFEQ